MHAFLICSKNKDNALKYAFQECKKSQIDKFDSNILDYGKPIGIEDVRNLQKKIILKPIKSKTKAVILDGSNGLTIEAQNALLKVLEEPPANTIIYITIPNKDLLLPTVLSRCKIITLKDSSELSKEVSTQYLNILMSMLNGSVGERLKLAQDIAKNKDEVIPWLEKMIAVARVELIDSVYHSEHSKQSHRILRRSAPRDDNTTVTQYLNILMSLTKTHTILKTTNVNQRSSLENLFLNL